MPHFPKLIIRRFLWEANQVDPAEADQKADLQEVQKEELQEVEVKVMVEDGRVQQAILLEVDAAMHPLVKVNN